MGRRRGREPDNPIRPMTEEADPDTGDSEWNESVGDDEDD